MTSLVEFQSILESYLAPSIKDVRILGSKALKMLADTGFTLKNFKNAFTKRNS